MIDACPQSPYRSRPRWAGMVLSIGILSLHLPSPVAAGTHESRAEASALLEEALQADNGPGVQAAVVIDGQLVWSVALGQADLEGRVAMDPTTRLRIGSVSKVLTSALAARLVEDGRLDPEATVQTYLPDFPEKGSPVTSRLLASHTSGIRHYDFSNMAEANNTHHYDGVGQALAVFAEDALEAAPRTRFLYSSFGFNLLGAVTEAAAGEPFLDALSSWVTAPLSLDDTVGDSALAIVPGRGRFYTLRDNGELINTIWRDSSDYYPSGGLLSTAQDLAQLTSAMFEGDFFGPRSKTLFTTPATLADGTPVPYSFGWQVKTDGDGTVIHYGHGGLTNGATAEVRYLPRQRMAIAVITNYNFWFADSPSTISVVTDVIPAVLSPPR